MTDNTNTSMGPEPERGLRLLSLDGGGVRGLSSLIILKEIMDRIKFDEKLESVPLPCEYFDLIGGTGTGGYVRMGQYSCVLGQERRLRHWASGHVQS